MSAAAQSGPIRTTRRLRTISTAAQSDGKAAPLGGAAVAADLWLARLTVTGFRNFRQAELECDARPVVLVGPNGGGKSNLLEAVSLLTPGRGLRRARLSDLDFRGPGNAREGAGPGLAEGEPGGWAVAAEVMTADGPRRLGTGRDPAAPGRDRRRVKVDGDFVAGQQALAEILSAVWLTPAMDRLFVEGPGARRRFLDRLVYGFDPAHAGRIAAYERALRERARLLGDGGRDAAWLAALEETMAERAVAIAAARRETLARLAGAAAQSVGAFPRAGLALAGEAEAWLEAAAAVEVEERLRARLRDSRPRDAALGGAAVGAHRSDLVVTHLDRAMPAALCSTGEQKALLISIVLAHARLLTLERGRAPLLLLDEVAAHLDPQHRDSLYEELLALRAQAWLSGTDRALFDALGGAVQRFAVGDAVVLRET